MTESSNFTWGYAVTAIVFVFVVLPALILTLRAIQVAVTRAVRRHVDRALTAPPVMPRPQERSHR